MIQYHLKTKTSLFLSPVYAPQFAISMNIAPLLMRTVRVQLCNSEPATKLILSGPKFAYKLSLCDSSFLAYIAQHSHLQSFCFPLHLGCERTEELVISHDGLA